MSSTDLKMMSVRVPVEIVAQLQRQAEQQGTTLSGIVNAVLVETAAGFGPSNAAADRATDPGQKGGGETPTPGGSVEAELAERLVAAAEPAQLLVTCGSGAEVVYQDFAGAAERLKRATDPWREGAKVRPGEAMVIHGLPTVCRA